MCVWGETLQAATAALNYANALFIYVLYAISEIETFLWILPSG